MCLHGNVTPHKIHLPQRQRLPFRPTLPQASNTFQRFCCRFHHCWPQPRRSGQRSSSASHRHSTLINNSNTPDSHFFPIKQTRNQPTTSTPYHIVPSPSSSWLTTSIFVSVAAIVVQPPVCHCRRRCQPRTDVPDLDSKAACCFYPPHLPPCRGSEL